MRKRRARKPSRVVQGRRRSSAYHTSSCDLRACGPPSGTRWGTGQRRERGYRRDREENVHGAVGHPTSHSLADAAVHELSPCFACCQVESVEPVALWSRKEMCERQAVRTYWSSYTKVRCRFLVRRRCKDSVRPRSTSSGARMRVSSPPSFAARCRAFNTTSSRRSTDASSHLRT